MLTKLIFLSLVAAVILQRLFELRLSQRNEVYLLSQGGHKHSDNFLPLVKLLQISWFIAMIAEVWVLERPLIPGLAVIALLVTVVGQILRYLSMRALQWRWTLPIIMLADQPEIKTGIYRYLRHPNWLGVILEIAALPLIHSAYLTALIFSLANTFLMIKRMQEEERAFTENTYLPG